MASLASFAKYVRPDVPMCPEIQILDAILRAGIEFCKRTKIMQESVDVTTVIGTTSYDLTTLMEANTEPNQVLSVRRDQNSFLEASSQDDAIRYRYDAQSGTPNYFYLDNRNLVLLREPVAVETLTALVTQYPSEAATTLPDALYQRYRLEIAAGAKFFLLSMPNKEWSNNETASLDKFLFDSAVDSENLTYAKGNGLKPLRSVINAF